MADKIFSGKKIVLGVGGGISAYKSVELLRQLYKLGAKITVIMTNNATKFIGPITFATLSNNKVILDLFKNNEDKGVLHINLALKTDLVILAPATANMIAKLANGIADDALSTFMLAVTCPVLICPSMNSDMYEHPATLKNLNKISKYGYFTLSCNNGELACGVSGPGRFPEPSEIIDRAKYHLCVKDFKFKKIIITAGPTREFMDPTRFISNPSSGKMGYAIASMAEYRGASVTLISGPVNIRSPKNIEVIHVTSADEMEIAVLKRFKEFDIIIKVAAISDYKPKKFYFNKVKKNTKEIIFEFERNRDILLQLGLLKNNKQILVGFAAETTNLISNAKLKLKQKRLDMIIANSVKNPEFGFDSDENIVSIISSNGKVENIPKMNKNFLANIILNNILKLINLKTKLK